MRLAAAIPNRLSGESAIAFAESLICFANRFAAASFGSTNVTLDAGPPLTVTST